MVFGKKVLSTARATKVLPFYCKKCGYSATAIVTGIGKGQGGSLYFLDNEGAERRSKNYASRNAEKNAYETIKIIPCPNCGKKDFLKVSKVWFTDFFKIAATLFFFLILSIILYFLVQEKFVFYIAGTAAVFTCILIFFIEISWRWTTAKNRVIFTDMIPEQEQNKSSEQQIINKVKEQNPDSLKKEEKTKKKIDSIYDSLYD